MNTINLTTNANLNNGIHEVISCLTQQTEEVINLCEMHDINVDINNDFQNSNVIMTLDFDNHDDTTIFCLVYDLPYTVI